MYFYYSCQPQKHIKSWWSLLNVQGRTCFIR